jgi:hypothetical protein
LTHSAEYGRTLRAGLRVFGNLLQRLHSRVSRRAISTSPEVYSIERIAETIAKSCDSDEISSVVTHSIAAYLTTRNRQIVALRATEVYSLVSDEDAWLVVEWLESDDLNCIAIFHFEDDLEVRSGSWLMHSGYQSPSEGPGSWNSSRVDWNVSEIDHLQILFGVAQHLLGILEWSVEDSVALYCQRQHLQEEVRGEYVPVQLELI